MAAPTVPADPSRDAAFGEDADAAASGMATALAAVWLARLKTQPAGIPAAVLPLPPALGPGGLAAALAELGARALAEDRTLLILVPDDESPADILGALDPALRPLCLALPASAFAAPVVVRATLSLLKSRLARGGEENHVPLWTRQQRRIEDEAAAWRAALAWTSAPGDGDWPAAVATLFPLRIVAAVRWASLAGAAADYAVALTPARLPDGAGQRSLLLQMPLRFGNIVVSDEGALLRAQLAILSQEVGHMELELATVQAEVGDFGRRYSAQVGALMAELDGLQAQLARRAAERTPEDAAVRQAAAEADVRAERSRQEQRQHETRATAETKPFRPTTDLKRLYRQIARRIHPDRALDDADRLRRNRLMGEANRAYRAGDETALRDVLAQWQAGHADTERPASSEGLLVQIERLKHRLAEIEAEMARVFSSRLYELFIAARLARRKGRDLLGEMAEELAGKIAAAKRALQA